MSDLKKLFKRDRFYWGIMAVVVTLVVTYMLTNVYGLYHKLFHLEDYIERSQYLHGLWDMHPELSNPDGVFTEEIPHWLLQALVWVTVMAALIAQMVKLFVQETQNRTEVLRTFPVKSGNLLICHYLSGLLMVGTLLLIQLSIIRLDILYVEKNTDFIIANKELLWICAGKALIIFMLHYSLLIVCKKVANHVPGTIFTFVVVEIAMNVLAGHSSNLHWNQLSVDNIPVWIFWIIVTVVLILLACVAEQKRDYARNGFYAFPIVHWVMMVTVFAEMYFIFYGVYEDIPKAVSFLVAVAAATLITTGVHFVAKPKTI